jgi:hypothetical protein
MKHKKFVWEKTTNSSGRSLKLNYNNDVIEIRHCLIYPDSYDVYSYKQSELKVRGCFVTAPVKNRKQLESMEDTITYLRKEFVILIDKKEFDYFKVSISGNIVSYIND